MKRKVNSGNIKQINQFRTNNRDKAIGLTAIENYPYNLIYTFKDIVNDDN